MAPVVAVLVFCPHHPQHGWTEAGWDQADWGPVDRGLVDWVLVAVDQVAFHHQVDPAVAVPAQASPAVFHHLADRVAVDLGGHQMAVAAQGMPAAAGSMHAASFPPEPASVAAPEDCLVHAVLAKTAGLHFAPWAGTDQPGGQESEHVGAGLGHGIRQSVLFWSAGHLFLPHVLGFCSGNQTDRALKPFLSTRHVNAFCRVLDWAISGVRPIPVGHRTSGDRATFSGHEIHGGHETGGGRVTHACFLWTDAVWTHHHRLPD